MYTYRAIHTSFELNTSNVNRRPETLDSIEIDLNPNYKRDFWNDSMKIRVRLCGVVRGKGVG